jgi:RHS repeat-associated protein
LDRRASPWRLIWDGRRQRDADDKAPGGSTLNLVYLGVDSDELITDPSASLHDHDDVGARHLRRRRRVGEGRVDDALSAARCARLDDRADRHGGQQGHRLGPRLRPVRRSPTVNTDVGFAGGYTVAASGSMKLVHFGKRFYDPDLGRWTQPDTLDQAGDLRQANLYLYVGQDPVNFYELRDNLRRRPAASCNTIPVMAPPELVDTAQASVARPLGVAGPRCRSTNAALALRSPLIRPASTSLVSQLCPATHSFSSMTSMRPTASSPPHRPSRPTRDRSTDLHCARARPWRRDVHGG